MCVCVGGTTPTATGWQCLSLKEGEFFQQSNEHSNQKKHRPDKVLRQSIVQSQVFLEVLVITVGKDEPTWALNRTAKK